MMSTRSEDGPTAARVAIALAALAAVAWVLHAAQALLVPLVVALLVFAIVNALDRQWLRLRVGGRQMPTLLATILSALVILAAVVVVALIVIDTAAAVAERAPEYQKRFVLIRETLEQHLGPLGPAVGSLGEDVRVTGIITQMATALGGALGGLGLVVVYVFFLLLERQFATPKLVAIFPHDGARRDAAQLIARIDHDVGTYLGMKTLVSLLTAVPSLVIMELVGLDFAPFWALLIFLLNFIPNVGSLIATVLPVALALLQFLPETSQDLGQLKPQEIAAMSEEELGALASSAFLGPVLGIALGVTAVQLIVANLVEPSLMGRTLNMSPLVVILALVAWSLLWGIAGAFLSVPVTAVALLVLARLPATRWIAVLLSRDGRLRDATRGVRPAR